MKRASPPKHEGYTVVVGGKPKTLLRSDEALSYALESYNAGKTVQIPEPPTLSPFRRRKFEALLKDFDYLTTRDKRAKSLHPALVAECERVAALAAVNGHRIESFNFGGVLPGLACGRCERCDALTFPYVGPPGDILFWQPPERGPMAKPCPGEHGQVTPIDSCRRPTR